MRLSKHDGCEQVSIHSLLPPLGIESQELSYPEIFISPTPFWIHAFKPFPLLSLSSNLLPIHPKPDRDAVTKQIQGRGVGWGRWRGKTGKRTVGIYCLHSTKGPPSPGSGHVEWVGLIPPLAPEGGHKPGQSRHSLPWFQQLVLGQARDPIRTMQLTLEQLGKRMLSPHWGC